MTNHVSTLNVLLYGEPIATITNVGNDRTLFAFMDSYIHDESRPVFSCAAGKWRFDDPSDRSRWLLDCKIAVVSI